jgi:hypothetical protein
MNNSSPASPLGSAGGGSFSKAATSRPCADWVRPPCPVSEMHQLLCRRTTCRVIAGLQSNVRRRWNLGPVMHSRAGAIRRTQKVAMTPLHCRAGLWRGTSCGRRRAILCCSSMAVVPAARLRGRAPSGTDWGYRLQRVRCWTGQAPGQARRRIIKINRTADAVLRHLFHNDSAESAPLRWGYWRAIKSWANKMISLISW